MSLLNQPYYESYVPYIKWNDYVREGGGSKNPRHRIEIAAPRIVEREMVQRTMPCVACGEPMNPFRLRKGGSNVYFAAACPLSVSVGCSRGRAAKEEYEAVVADLKRRKGKRSA